MFGLPCIVVIHLHVGSCIVHFQNKGDCARTQRSFACQFRLSKNVHSLEDPTRIFNDTTSRDKHPQVQSKTRLFLGIKIEQRICFGCLWNNTNVEKLLLKNVDTPAKLLG